MGLWQRLSGVMGPVRTVVLVTQDDRTFKGVLVHLDRNFAIMRAAKQGVVDAQQGEQWVPMDGDLVVPRENIAYWQEALPVDVLD